MICPNCGTQLPDSARFCHECGTRLEEIPQTPYIPGETQLADPSQPQEPRRRNTKKIVAIVAVVAVLLVGGGLLAWNLIANTRSAAHGTHPVTFRVGIDDYDTSSSRIPVSITGTDADGNAVDEIVYLAYSGVDTELATGTYHVRAVGSPISAAGVIYRVPTTTIDLTLGDDLAPGEAYELPNDLALVFEPIDAADVTEEEIADAVEWARKDEQSGADVGALEQAARARRERAGIEVLDGNGLAESEEPRKDATSDDRNAGKDRGKADKDATDDDAQQKAIEAAEAEGKQVLVGTVRVMTGYEVGETYDFDAEAAVGTDAANDWVLLVFDKDTEVEGNNGDGVGSRTESLDRIRLPKSMASFDGKKVTVAVDDVWFASDTVGLIAMAGAEDAEVLG